MVLVGLWGASIKGNGGTQIVTRENETSLIYLFTTLSTSSVPSLGPLRDKSPGVPCRFDGECLTKIAKRRRRWTTWGCVWGTRSSLRWCTYYGRGWVSQPHWIVREWSERILDEKVVYDLFWVTGIVPWVIDGCVCGTRPGPRKSEKHIRQRWWTLWETTKRTDLGWTENTEPRLQERRSFRRNYRIK